MQISLFTSGGRLILGLLAVAAGIAALVLSRLARGGQTRPRLEAAGMLLAVLAGGLILLLAGERVLALVVTRAAPGDLAYNERRVAVLATLFHVFGGIPGRAETAA